MEEENVKPESQSRLISGSAIILIGKFIAYYITDSVGILTGATVETIVNFIAGITSLFCLKAAFFAKDIEHAFRHGKSVQISASIEGEAGNERNSKTIY